MRRDLPFIFTVAILLVLSVILLYLMVSSPERPVSGQMAPPASNWTISGLAGDPLMLEYYNLFFGDDGVTYTIDGKNIHAIGPDGRVRWNFSIPDLAGDQGDKTWSTHSAAIDNDTLYVKLMPLNAGSSEPGELLVISPEGKLLWGTDDPPSYFSVKNGRLYASKNNVTVYDRDGTVAWTADGLTTYPPLVDDTGTSYFVDWSYPNTIYVYGPDGRLKTKYDTADYGLGNFTYIYSICPQLYYNDHTVYVPMDRGLIALGDGGVFKWKVALSDSNARLSFWNEMFDKKGNVYLENNTRIYYVTPAGQEGLLTDKYDPYWHGVSGGAGLVSVEDGVYYTVRTVSAAGGAETNGYDVASGPIGWHTPGPGNRSILMLDTCQVTAYDLKAGEPRWNITLPMDERIVNATSGGSSQGPVQGYSKAGGVLSNGTLYVRFWSNNTEMPGMANYAYAGGIYAINKDGGLAWYEPMGSRVLGMRVWDGRIVYYTADGNISAFKPPAPP